MKSYPIYYRRGATCIKRESPTTGKQVDIPEACRIHDVGFRIISTPDKGTFDRMVKGMESATFEVYEKYLIILHEMSRKQPAAFRESHDHTPEFAGTSARRTL